ncbi:MAG: hypothetical protein GY853_13365 [PVC group bacterium]|nr:hypothetical protein [PVC group bacterium]
MKNIQLGKLGVLKKRFGYAEIYNFGGPVLGWKRSGDDYTIIIANDGTTTKMWEWDMETADSDAEMISDGHLVDITPSGVTLDDDAEWSMVKHYDTNVGETIMMCNGEDGLFAYDESAGTVSQINSTDTDFLPKFVASYYQRLFVAHTNNALDVSSEQYAPFAVYWSTAGDATDWTAASGAGWQYRYERAADITGLIVWNDGLYLGKRGEWWQVFPGGAGMRLVNTEHGPQTIHGVLAADRLYFAEEGKIFTYPDNQWLSYPVHSNMAASAPGSWNEFSSADDEYLQQVIFSTGPRMWIYDKMMDSWGMYEFVASKVKVVGDLPPYQRFLYQQGEVILANQNIILAEDDILSDIAFVIDDSILCKQVHAYYDGTRDNEQPIQMQYDTRWENCGEYQNKRFRKITVQGKITISPEYLDADTENPDTEDVDIMYDVSDYPGLPSFPTSTESVKRKTCTFRGGEANFNIDATGRWITVRLEETSKYNVELYNIMVEWQPAGDR